MKYNGNSDGGQGGGRINLNEEGVGVGGGRHGGCVVQAVGAGVPASRATNFETPYPLDTSDYVGMDEHVGGADMPTHADGRAGGYKSSMRATGKA